MKRITGLLIDPVNRISTIVCFVPTPANFHRLTGIQRLIDLSTQDERLCHTVAACEAVEDDRIVYRRGWDRPAAGRVLITGARDSEGNHTSLTPQQIGGCRRTHRIGTLYCAGIVEWSEMRKAAPPAPTLFDRPAPNKAPILTIQLR